MTPIAITLLALSLFVAWGGLIGSIVLLSRHPEADGVAAEPGDDQAAAEPAR